MTRISGAAGHQGTAGPSASALLERAVSYALDSVAAVRPALLRSPTPCQGWDLHALLSHACESIQALQEGIATGRVRLAAAPDSPGQGCSEAQAFALRAVALLDTWSLAHQQVVFIGGCALATGLLAGAGALEIAVHGWDISQACGDQRPIPAALARDLAEIAPSLVTDADRGLLFAAPVAVAATASPSDRLAAFLGRATSSGGGDERLSVGDIDLGDDARHRDSHHELWRDPVPAAVLHCPVSAHVTAADTSRPAQQFSRIR